MHGKKRDVLCCAKTQEAESQQWSIRKIHWPLCFFVDESERFSLTFRLVQISEISNRYLHLSGGFDNLYWLIRGHGEYGAYDFVPSEDLAERLFQSADFHRAVQAHCHGNVVHRAVGVKLVQEPQSLLRKRQRQRLIS